MQRQQTATERQKGHNKILDKLVGVASPLSTHHEEVRPNIGLLELQVTTGL